MGLIAATRLHCGLDLVDGLRFLNSAEISERAQQVLVVSG